MMTIEVLFAGLVALYLLWLLLFLCYERWKRKKTQKTVAAILPRQNGLNTEIIGKSKFVLPASVPLGATLKPVGATDEKADNQIEKDSTFAPVSEEHPLQVPDEELDKMFDDAPTEGESNDPMDIDVSMDYEEDEDEIPDRTPPGAIASGVSFEDMCSAVKVLNQPKGTVSEQEERQAGQTFSELQHTDMMQQILSGEPKKSDRVSELINLHLDAFRKQQDEPEEATNESGSIPDDFGLNDIV